MKILLVNSHKFGGVEHYRALAPLSLMSTEGYEATSINYLHPTEDSTSGEIVINDEWIKQFDLVHFIRQIGFNGHTQGIADRLNKLGIPFGLDLDDYWHLPDNHLIAEEYNRGKTTETIIESIKVSHFVTCTTSILAKEIEQYNKNVYILENGINPLDPVWQPEHTPSEVIRFGLMLGSTHYHDLKKIAPSLINMLRSPNKCQIALAGFNAELNKPSMYVAFERTITDNHNVLDRRYSQYLKTCNKEQNYLWVAQKYVRLWGVPVEEWGYQYRNIDISVAPLIDNKFNNCKSELKMIEAGFKGKGVIVSNVYPFKLLATEQNAYICNSSAEFYDKMKRAINNPNEVADKIAQLRQDVLERYDLRKINEKRKELYKLL